MTTIKEDQEQNSEIEIPDLHGKKGHEENISEHQGGSVSFGPTSVEEYTTGPKQDEADDNDKDDGECNVRFPLPFYDPTTMQVMKDPVVDPEGNSIENPVANHRDQSSAVVYYPNRALKSIIQRQVELACPSFVGTLRRLDDAVWKSWNKLVDKSLIGGNTKPLPEAFYCPITAEVMVDPVITPNGHTYERMAIEHWVRANGTNPISRDPLSLSSLRRNNNLYDLIQHEKNKNESARHPSIRRWKETTAETSRRDDFHYDDETAAATGTATNNNMPTTYGEIDAVRQRQRNTKKRSIMLVVIFTGIIVVSAFPYAFVFLLFCIGIFLSALLLDSLDRVPSNDTS